MIEAALVTGEDIKKLSEKMVAMVEEHGMKFFLRDADNILPVSYTHLDVYKRQFYDCAISCGFGRLLYSTSVVEGKCCFI